MSESLCAVAFALGTEHREIVVVVARETRCPTPPPVVFRERLSIFCVHDLKNE